MKRPTSALLFGAALAAASLSHAEEPPRAPARSGAAPSKAQSVLRASSRRSGVTAHFSAEGARFFGCSDPCVAGDERALSVELPKEVGRERPRIDVVGTKDDPVLWVRWGSDERFYSVIVVGALSNEKEGATPLLILKGWAGEKSEQKSLLTRGADGELRLELAPAEAFCGRILPQQTRVLRPEEGRFVTVRLPVLEAREREGAVRTQGHPWTGSETSLVALDAKGPRSAGAPVDGDRTTPWDGAFEFTEVKIPEGADGGRWIFEFAAPLAAPTALYVVVSDKVYQAEFGPEKTKRSPADSQRYAIEIEADSASCVAFAQPRTPAQVTEIMGTATELSARSTMQLISELELGEPGLADAALRARGAEAAGKIAKIYRKMSPFAQTRAFNIAQKLPGTAPLSVFAQAVEVDAGQSTEAVERLAAAGPAGAEALFARLRAKKASGDRELIAALVRVDPIFAARNLPLLLGTKRADLRASLRDALHRLMKVEAARAELVKSLSPPRESRGLPLDAQVEVLRALGPELAHLAGARDALGRLAESADFRRAYLLAPLIVKNFDELEGAREILRAWLLGKVKGQLDKPEKAALLVGILDALLEHGRPGVRLAMRESLSGSLAEENMRVRRAALFNLARSETTVPGLANEVLDLLVGDPWPQVRAAAAQAAVSVSGAKWDERMARVFLRRLHKDEDPTVRRAIARALSTGAGEEVLSGLRRSFEKDKEYAVRAEAAVSLGKLCDARSIDALTARALALGTGLTDEGAIELGLSSVTALAYLAPRDINKRLAPLLSEKAQRLTRSQVLGRIEAVRASADGKSCAR